MKMALDRRQFLMLSAGLGAGIVLFKFQKFLNLKSSVSGTVIGGGQGMIDGQLVHYLSLINLDQAQPEPLFYRMSFLPHGVSLHPQKSHLLALFEKKGPGACELDLQTGHVVRMITTDPSRYFYGHGTYSADGNHLYSTETILASEEGAIVQRNAQTMAIEGLFPTYGANPHDCQLIENGTVLAITNGGRKTPGPDSTPCVSYVDVKTQKLIHQYPMTDSRFNTGHLTVTQDKKLFVASAPHPSLPASDPGAFSLLAADGTLQNLNTPTFNVNLKSETLSLCIDEVRGVAAATSPAGNVVTFWSLKTYKLLSTLELQNPRGIVMTADHRHYAISHGKDAALLLVDADTRTKTDIQIPQAGYSGSHLYLLS